MISNRHKQLQRNKYAVVLISWNMQIIRLDDFLENNNSSSPNYNPFL